MAAQHGYLAVCQLIIKNVEDKNPRDQNGRTPLHLAAENGHLAICQLILENVQDKNPKDRWGCTPSYENLRKQA